MTTGSASGAAGSGGARSTSPRVAARRADRRDEILDAAWELAREEGLAGLSLRALAQRVGMQAPSLYSYFDSKDAIYDGMFVRGYADLQERFASADRAPTDAAAALADTARRFVEFANEDAARFQLLFQYAIPGWHPSEEAYAVAVGAFAELAELCDHIGLDDPAAVDTWTAVLTGLASQQIANDPGGDRWLRLVDGVAAMFVAHHLPAAD